MIGMGKVYLLWHTTVLANHEENLLLGVYASSSDARAAQARVADKPGFRESPQGFEISEYQIGRDQWPEGFVLAK
jgi:hypothetical protein